MTNESDENLRARLAKAEAELAVMRKLADASLAPDALIERAFEAEKSAGLMLVSLTRLRATVIAYATARHEDASTPCVSQWSGALLDAKRALDAAVDESADVTAMGEKAIAAVIGAALAPYRESARLGELERQKIAHVIEEIRAEAAEWADHHRPDLTDESDYASGLLSAALDVEEAMR